MILEEDRLVLHDITEVNLKVDFFLGTRKEYLEQQKCVTYSVCWEQVNVRVEQIVISEQISDLDFYYSRQQLIIDDHVLSGEVINFNCRRAESGLIVYCVILLGRDY